MQQHDVQKKQPINFPDVDGNGKAGDEYRVFPKVNQNGKDGSQS